MKKGEKTKPDVYYDRVARLKPEDRQELRAILTSPLFVKLLRIVAGEKPSPNCTGAGSTTRDQFSDARANARLGEIRGWDLYEFALFKALNDAPAPRIAAEEKFSEKGMLDIEPRLPAS